MFARYAAIVKNLRGVTAFDLEEEGVWDSIKWLVKRFRYRDLGLTPSILSRYRKELEPMLNGNPFRELVYPIPQLEDVTKLFAKELGLPIEVAELLAFSSIYISPAIIVGNRFLEYISRLAIDKVCICKDMDINSWKLHLRIADYTVLDFYESAVTESLEAIEKISQGVDISQILYLRKERIEKDKKRYWRIICSEGKPFLFYIDNLALIVKIPRQILSSYLRPEHAAALAIIDVVYIPPGMK